MMNETNKQPISVDCILVCLYFTALPLTVVTTPWGSLLKLISIPIAVILGARLLLGRCHFTLNYIHFTYTVYILYTVALLLMYRNESSVTITKDMALGLLMLIMISVRIYNEREREWMETAWIIVGVVCVIAALTSTESLSKTESRAVIRIFGFEEDQNHFCAYFIMAMLVSIKRILQRRKFYPLYILLIILSFYSIFKTGSRGGLIGVLAGIFVYILLGMKNIKSRIAITIVGVLVGVAVITVVFPNLPEDVRERYSVESVMESGGTGRFEIWGYLLNYTARSSGRMIHGSGVFSSNEILSKAGFLNGVAHNAYIQVLSDEGIIGLFLFLTVIAACLIRTVGRQTLYVCAFISLLAFSMSLTFYVFKPYLNIMMMCAMTFEKDLPENVLRTTQRGDQNNV
uniref:O-antigen ligase-related domain-containing protein n=1 Tax=uncultured Bacillota bacterium TaxID=344338 RepID=A0A650EN32_9FIRM|nr:hypothetical protein Firmicute1046_3430 [uncultured Firmicutes bacterium]